LRGYAQKNPKQEYKRETFELFSEMLGNLKTEVVGIVSRVQVKAEKDVEAVEKQRRQQAPMSFQHDQASAVTQAEGASAQGQGPQAGPAGAQDNVQHQPFVRTGKKVGRNDPCPCGSGKKYKQCHGKL